MVRQFAAGRAAAAVAQRGAPASRCALRRGRGDLCIGARRHSCAAALCAPSLAPACALLHSLALCAALTRRAFAAQFGRAEVAQYLLNHGADPEAMDAKYGSTALHTASFNGHLEVAMVLLDAGANVDARNKNELTPLHYAASNGHVALARLFLERGADAYARSREGRTPLEKAEGRPEMLAVLRDALRRTQARPGAGVLIPATVRNDLRSMLAALAAGEDVDAADDDGWTALHYAASLGLLSAARLLLERGGSQAVRDHAGLTPAQVAQQAGRADVVRALADWASLPPTAVAAGAAAVPARFLEASAALAAAASGPPGAAAGAHAWQQHDAHAGADDGYGDDGVDDADVSAPGEGEDEGEWVATEEDYARYAQYLEDDVEDAGAFARSAAGAAALEAARVATAAEAAAAARGDFSHGQRVAASGAPAPKKRVAPPAQQQQAPAQHAQHAQQAQQARSPQHRAAPAAAPAAPNPTQQPTAVPLTPREQQQRAVADGKAAARQAVVEGAAAAAAAAAAADGAQSAEERAAAAATLREELTRRRVAEGGHHKDGGASPGHKAGGDNGPPSAHKRRGHGKARSRPPQRGSGAVGGLFRFWATAAAAAAAALAIKAVLRPSRAPVYYYEDEEYDDEPAAKAPAAPGAAAPAAAAPAGVKSK